MKIWARVLKGYQLVEMMIEEDTSMKYQDLHFRCKNLLMMCDMNEKCAVCGRSEDLALETECGRKDQRAYHDCRC